MNRLTDADILLAMRPAMRSFTPGGHGGSHTAVLFFEEGVLTEILQDLAARNGGDPSSAAETARRIARRFLVKVGNISDYVVKLRGGKESVIRRHLVSEVFGNLGYNLAPTADKVKLDAREAVREIPYLAYGEPPEQFAPDILSEVRSAVTGIHLRGNLRNGVFLIEEDSCGRLEHTAFSILSHDPYFFGRIEGFSQLARFQKYLRSNPLDATIRERLRDFFEAPMTVGVRDILRYLEGARHPDLGWKRAEEVILQCFNMYGTENFLPPEINYYTRSIWIEAEDARNREANNQKASSAFAQRLIERLPLTWTLKLSDTEIQEIARGILALHFDYPIYEVEPYSGIVSAATARFLIRLTVGLIFHLTGAEIPERRNPMNPVIAERIRSLARFMEGLSSEERVEFCKIVNFLLWEVAVRGGVLGRDGRLYPYSRIERTFYSFQEKAQWAVERLGTVEEMMTLEELIKDESVLRKHPAIARKLVVFFVLIYRYFLDTGHVPDLRPDDAGRDLFLRGIWGYSTRNVLIVTGHTSDGQSLDVVRFVDNKDQFKQYRRFEDRAEPMGLAKYGLRLIHPLVQPAMERSIGIFTDIAARQDGYDVRSSRRLTKVIGHVLHEGVSGALTHLQAFLDDAIDDTVDGLDRILQRFIR